MASDEAPDGRIPGKQPPNFGFQWVSSSPSPAEVTMLESRFPEVVQLPIADLEAESSVWTSRAVLMRTFHRWVPPEAFLREFRRGGVPGEIAPLSLSFRCHIFTFDNLAVRDEVLHRPWVINGQPVAAEAWRPEFIPANDAVTSALLWIRLPNLPIEFWKEEFLREIVAPAGQFVRADAATMAKSRGGFARVCARVQLLSPLRPGTRVQGLSGPFWQSFIFEQMDGICSRCASLHLMGECSAGNGECSAGNSEQADDRVEDLKFGPWMSAIRRRKGRLGSHSEDHGKKKMADPLSASSVPRYPASEPLQDQVQGVEGWTDQSSLLQRRRLRRSKMPGSQAGTLGHLQGGKATKASLAEGHKGNYGRAELKLKGNVQLSGVSDSQPPEPDSLNFPMSKNPFASLVMEVGGISTMGVMEDALSPLKRARPVDYQAPRLSSKLNKKKGKCVLLTSKAKQAKPNALEDLTEHIQPLDQCHTEDLSGVKTLVIRGSSSSVGPFSGDQVDQGAELMSSQENVVQIALSGSPQRLEDSTGSSGCRPDSVMDEGQGGSSLPLPSE